MLNGITNGLDPTKAAAGASPPPEASSGRKWSGMLTLRRLKRRRHKRLSPTTFSPTNNGGEEGGCALGKDTLVTSSCWSLTSGIYGTLRKTKTQSKSLADFTAIYRKPGKVSSRRGIELWMGPLGGILCYSYETTQGHEYHANATKKYCSYSTLTY